MLFSCLGIRLLLLVFYRIKSVHEADILWKPDSRT
jgi:hypothetical protein